MKKLNLVLLIASSGIFFNGCTNPRSYDINLNFRTNKKYMDIFSKGEGYHISTHNGIEYYIGFDSDFDSLMRIIR